ncbi:MAG TPA: YCF48-related protein, partial [Ignavibacteria bacterium]|nr:YCF48-related protein [Ignavibacteria bacterium]
QWVQQPTGTTNSIRDVEFINQFTGWACGDNQIYKTTNGGENWFTQTHPTNNLIQGIWPVDSMVVYASGWFNTILKTTDGGENWIALRNGNPPDQPSFESPFFLNKDTGWICGSDIVFRTTNGGLSFDSIHTFAFQHDIFFKNYSDGVMCGDAANFFKTTNSGVNWIHIPVVSGPGQPNFWRLSFINDTTGWLIGFSGGVYKTTDFGYTWDSIGNVMSPTNIYTVEFADENTGWAGGASGVIYRSTDGGLNWHQQVTSTQFNSGFIRSMYAYNDSIVWAVGNVGKILHTTNGGTSSILQTGNEIPSDFTLEQNYPNPFNNSTRIRFSIKERSSIKLEVYDLLGRRIEFTEYGNREPGSYIINYNASKLSSGVYFYRLYSGERSQIKKFVLTK